MNLKAWFYLTNTASLSLGKIEAGFWVMLIMLWAMPTPLWSLDFDINIPSAKAVKTRDTRSRRKDVTEDLLKNQKKRTKPDDTIYNTIVLFDYLIYNV